MEILLLVAPPLLFLAAAAAMLVVSHVSGWLTFMKYSRRQQSSNRAMFGYAARLRRLSETLARGSAELDNLNRLKTRFMSMAAHDMRTPIATIRGCAELMSDRPLMPRDRRAVESILISTDNVGRLMSDLTDLSIIEAGKLRVERSPVEAASLLSDALAAYGPLAASKGVELSVGVAPAVTVYADRFRLGQVLGNLVGNAVKFTPPGGRVRISAAAGGAGALFSVADSGPGIHPSELKRVFETFYQSRFGDPTAARKGWGLGLSIAFEIARAHGGEIGAQSAGLGRGARFWCFVPSRPPAKGSAKAPRSLLALASLALALALPAGAQNRGSLPSSAIPIEDRARYDKLLEEKADSILLRMLGPNRAKVIVDSTLDFTRAERIEVPTAFVKKRVVTIIIDKKITDGEAESIEKVVTNLLDVDPNRGDVQTVIRAAFAPAWRTVWYSTDYMSMLFKYALIAALALIALFVVAWCFLKLTGAIEAMAKAQIQQFAMDVDMKPQPEDQSSDLARLDGPQAAAVPEHEDDGGRDLSAVIEVKPHQIETLVELLAGEDPENIALVCAYLEPDARKRFMSALSADTQAEVIMNMSAVRFVDEELIAKIKSEIEQRLACAVGGMGHVYDFIETAPSSLQRQLLHELETKDPALHQQLRKKVLLMEDLLALTPAEWPVLIGRTRIENWAAALSSSPARLAKRVEEQVLSQTWAIVSQSMESSGSSQEKALAAQVEILDETRRLIAEGKIHDLVADRPEPAEAL